MGWGNKKNHNLNIHFVPGDLFHPTETPLSTLPLSIVLYMLSAHGGTLSAIPHGCVVESVTLLTNSSIELSRAVSPSEI